MMDIISRAHRTLAVPLALSLLLGATAVEAAPTGKAKRPPAAPKQVVANNSIIPLPLNPVVPAAQRLCASRTPSGLGYTILRPGTGAKPAAKDTALVNYVGYLAATGTVFDQGMRSALGVDEVIAGFSEGLQMLSRSGVVRLCIPAALGYGAREAGPIPANSDLVFQVELVDFKSAAEVESMRRSETVAPLSQTDGAQQP